MTKRAYGWVWLCDFGLCYWAESSREKLLQEGKPSPEAKPVRVELVPTNKKVREKLGL